MTIEEAIKQLKKCKSFHNGSYGTAINLAIKALEQEPKTGHWEWVQYDSNLNIGNWHCSECRGICTEMHSIEDVYNYCPNCGAKMEAENEKETC